LPARRNVNYPSPNSPLLILFNPNAAQSVANLYYFINKFWIPLKSNSKLVGEVLHITGIATDNLSSILKLDLDLLEKYSVFGVGFIPDLRRKFNSSFALISPTFFGGGIRKKILEGMANQIPVIASDLDISSVNFFKTNENILSMSSKDDFEANIRLLRESPPQWLNIVCNARDSIEQHANWKIYSNCIDVYLNKLKVLDE